MTGSKAHSAEASPLLRQVAWDDPSGQGQGRRSDAGSSTYVCLEAAA